MAVGGGDADGWVCMMVAAGACWWWLSVVVAVNCETKRKMNTTPKGCETKRKRSVGSTVSHQATAFVLHMENSKFNCLYPMTTFCEVNFRLRLVKLSLSASKLRDLDIASKSDPMAVVYAKKRDGRLDEIGRTEVIMNNLNPAWIGKISIAFQFEIVQPLLFRVYDVDTKYHNIPVKMLKLEDQDFLGEASCVLSEIVTKQNRTLTLKLHNNYGLRVSRNFGILSVHAEETVASKSAVEIAFRCSYLQNVDLFSKSDPFLRISRIVESGNSVPIYKTEVINNNLNPIWRPITLSMQQFVSKENPLIIECFDFNTSGNHVLMGFSISVISKIQKSVGDLEKLHQERTGATFMLPSTQRGHDKVLKSQLFVEKFVEQEQYSFLDYISSGFELNFMVAVDFTASNGNPRNPNSLHYIDPSGRLNSYQQAITEIGEVIQFYDSDRRFPAWGFGGKTFDGTVSHCFNLNGRAGSFEVDGVEGIMAAYASALNNVSLAGPTLFGQVINTAARIAGQSLSYDRSKYFVLLIITDGVLTDLQETKDALVRASDLPLSILIVGVGGADFTQMEILDADNGRRLESSTDRVATRDIVQFVPMREVHSGQISVVQALLEELPGQFLTYMRCRDIKPLNVQMAQTCA
ncbi:protein BONZAI 3 [Citrus sinensis]|nr:protein BONZAI 3 [Citrus sinensis]